MCPLEIMLFVRPPEDMVSVIRLTMNSYNKPRLSNKPHNFQSFLRDLRSKLFVRSTRRHGEHFIVIPSASEHSIYGDEHHTTKFKHQKQYVYILKQANDI